MQRAVTPHRAVLNGSPPREAAYGPHPLGLVALGLIAYGIFQFVKARYRVIRAT